MNKFHEFIGTVVWYFMFQSQNYYLPKHIQKIKAKTFTKCRFAI